MQILKLLRGVVAFLTVVSIRVDAGREIACDGRDFECEGSYNFIRCEYSPSGQKIYAPNRCRPGTVCNPSNSPADPCDFYTVPSTTISTAPTSTADRATTLSEASTLPYIRPTPRPNYGSKKNGTDIGEQNSVGCDVNGSFKVDFGVNVSNPDATSNETSTNVTTSVGFQPGLVIETSTIVEFNKDLYDDPTFSGVPIQRTLPAEINRQALNSTNKMDSSQFSVSTITESLIRYSHAQTQKLVTFTSLQFANSDSGVTINLTTDVNAGKTNTNDIALTAQTTVFFGLGGLNNFPEKFATDLTVDSSKLFANMPEKSLKINTDNETDGTAVVNVTNVGDAIIVEKDTVTPAQHYGFEITRTPETSDWVSSATSKDISDDALTFSEASLPEKVGITADGESHTYGLTTSVIQNDGMTERRTNRNALETSNLVSTGENVVPSPSYNNMSTTVNSNEYANRYSKIIEQTYTNVSSLTKEFLELLRTPNDLRNSSQESVQSVLHNTSDFTLSYNHAIKENLLTNLTADVNAIRTDETISSFSLLNLASTETVSTQIEPSVNAYMKHKDNFSNGSVLNSYELSMQPIESIGENTGNASEKILTIFGTDNPSNDSNVRIPYLSQKLYEENTLLQNASPYNFEDVDSTSSTGPRQVFVTESIVKFKKPILTNISKETLNETSGMIDALTEGTANNTVTKILRTHSFDVFNDTTQTNPTNLINYSISSTDLNLTSVGLSKNDLQQIDNTNSTIEDPDVGLRKVSTNSPPIENYYDQKIVDARNELLLNSLNTTATFEGMIKSQPSREINQQNTTTPAEFILPSEASVPNKTTRDFFISQQDANEKTAAITSEFSTLKTTDLISNTSSTMFPTDSARSEGESKTIDPTHITKPTQISAEIKNFLNVTSLEVNKGDALSVESTVQSSTQKSLTTSIENVTAAANYLATQPELGVAPSENVDRGVRALEFKTLAAYFNTTTEAYIQKNTVNANDPIRYNMTVAVQDEVENFNIGQQIEKDILAVDPMTNRSLFSLKVITMLDDTPLRLNNTNPSNLSSWLLNINSYPDANLNHILLSKTNNNNSNNNHNNNTSTGKTETIHINSIKNNNNNESTMKTSEGSTISPNWPDMNFFKQHPVISETTFHQADELINPRANQKENTTGEIIQNAAFANFQGNSNSTQKSDVINLPLDGVPSLLLNSFTSSISELNINQFSISSAYLNNFDSEKSTPTAKGDFVSSSTTEVVPSISRESPYNFEKISYRSQNPGLLEEIFIKETVVGTNTSYLDQTAISIAERNSVNGNYSKTTGAGPSLTSLAVGNNELNVFDTVASATHKIMSSNMSTTEVSSSNANFLAFTDKMEAVSPLGNTNATTNSTFSPDIKNIKPITHSNNASGISQKPTRVNVSQEQIALAAYGNTTQSKREPSFLCTSHGVFPDLHDCRQYYLCVQQRSIFVKIVGTCPFKMAFNANVQRCERDVSCCYNEKCKVEGNFTDPLDATSYFSCVEIGGSVFHKYHLQCHSPLKFNPTERRCGMINSLSTQNQSTSTISLQDIELTTMPNPISYSEHNLIEPDYREMHATTNNYETAFIESFPVKDSNNVSSAGITQITSSESITESAIRAIRSASIFECSQDGLFSNPAECREYYMCVRKADGGFSQILRQCPKHYAFHARTKSCSRDLAVCSDLWCHGVGNFPDPKDENSYYRCVPNASGGFRIYHIICAESKVYVHNKNACFENTTEVTTPLPFPSATNETDSNLKAAFKVNTTVVNMVTIETNSETINHRDKVARKYPVVSEQYRMEAERKLRGILHDMRDEAVRQHEAELLAERKSYKLESDSNASSHESSNQLGKISGNASFECREEGRFPDANNCRKYYICSKVRTETIKLHHLECRGSDLFDARKRICVDAEDASCV